MPPPLPPPAPGLVKGRPRRGEFCPTIKQRETETEDDALIIARRAKVTPTQVDWRARGKRWDSKTGVVLGQCAPFLEGEKLFIIILR